MQADSSVELGSGEDCLEVPWAALAGDPRYYDLKRQPELLLNIAEALEHPELGEFLGAINSERSMLESVKCDAWSSNEITPEEEIYGAPWKFGSYVDLIFSEPGLRCSFASHENFAQRAARLLGKAPEIAAGAEFIVRRCFYRRAESGPADVEPGFGFTFYLHGYGDDPEDARRRWAIGMKLAENALLQLSASHRRGTDQTAAPGPRSA